MKYAKRHRHSSLLTCAPKFQNANSNALLQMGLTFPRKLISFFERDNNTTSSSSSDATVVFNVEFVFARNSMGRKVTTLNICRTKLSALGTGFPSMAYMARNVEFNVP